MEPALESTEREVERHAAGLRALACSVLGDASRAEDVLQDTWLKALERRAAPPVPVARAAIERWGAWLASVARNLARRERRSDERRRERERSCARPEAVEAADETAARREALARLTAAVLALPEPYHGAIVLRYFEQLAPGEIAARLGVPPATVKSRLQRGLERLREELARPAAHGERRRLEHGLALLAHGSTAPLSAVSGTMIVGVIGMGSKVQVGACAVLLGACAWLVLRGDSAEPVGAARPRTGAEPVALALAAAPAPLASARGAESPALAAPAASGDRRAAIPAELGFEDQSRPFVPDPYEYELAVRVLDERDLPLDGVDVWLAPRRRPLNHAGTTDARGELRVRWRAAVAAMDVVLAARAGSERDTGLRSLEIRAGESRATVWLGARGEPRLAEVVLTELDEPSWELLDPSSLVVSAPFELASDTEAYDGCPEVAREPDGFALFTERDDAAQCGGRASNKYFTLKGERLTALRLNLELVQIAELQELIYAARSEPAPDRFALDVLALGGDAAPLPGAIVAWGSDPDALREVGRTGDDGHLRWESEWTPDSASGWLRVGGQGEGIACAYVDTAPGRALELALEVDRALELAGRLVGPDGAPLAGWIVEAESLAAPLAWWDGTATDAEGRFAIPNAPGDVLRVAVLSPRCPLPLTVRTFDGLFAGGEPVELELREQDLLGAALSIDVLRADGSPADLAEAALWQLDSGRGIRLQATSGPLSVAGLPPGCYLLEVGAPRHAWQTRALVVGPGAAGSDPLVETVTLEPLVPLHVRPDLDRAADAPATWLELRRRADGIATRWWTGARAPEWSGLAAGEWELVAGGDGAPPRALSFELRPGQPAALAVQRDGTQPARLGSIEPPREPPPELLPGGARCAACHESRAAESTDLWRFAVERGTLDGVLEQACAPADGAE